MLHATCSVGCNHLCYTLLRHQSLVPNNNSKWHTANCRPQVCDLNTITHEAPMQPQTRFCTAAAAFPDIVTQKQHARSQHHASCRTLAVTPYSSAAATKPSQTILHAQVHNWWLVCKGHPKSQPAPPQKLHVQRLHAHVV
eukprot:GHRQ01022688.1.p2 GENE.GHRQ01022688.1~~GHRQ01022688.1.p2  ORF type:complete len:140 (+),score=17.87 GHRQ01022688.1:447-866(+)